MPRQKGFNHSVKTRNKMSVSLIGNKRALGKHWKISKIRKNSFRTEETKKKISKAHIGMKPSKETLKRMSESHSGEKCYLWKGGKSFEKYTIDWTISLRISIRERDKYTCKLCGEKQGDMALDIHHIDYNKKNCDINNLVALCRKCHMKTNIHREYWIDYFNKLL